MGATCAPAKKTEETPSTDMDKKAVAEAPDDALPQEKFTTIINQYQAANERLEAEKAEKAKEADNANQARLDTARENDTLLAELKTMRANLEKQKTIALQANLQTALHTRATNMLQSESAAKLLLEGKVEKFGKAGARAPKTKFVEVFHQNGQHTNQGFEAGQIVLHYSESKKSSSAIRGRVLKVLDPQKVPDQYKGRTFSVLSVVEGSEKELVFACPDPETRDKWVAAFQSGFDQIDAEIKDMHTIVEMSIEFSKPKLGIRVEEKVVEPAEDEKEAETQEKAEDETPAAEAAEEVEPGKAEAKADAEAEPAAAEEKDGEADEQEEQPCVLIVTAISDEDLKGKGLVESMSLVGINDTKFTGMVYSQQLKLLTETPKPFKLTFTGEKYLSKKTVSSSVTHYPEILKQLLAPERNNTQAAFEGIIEGTPFQTELKEAEDPNQLIKSLLCDQRKLMALLTSVQPVTHDL